jgi:hypothetical protein
MMLEYWADGSQSRATEYLRDCDDDVLKQVYDKSKNTDPFQRWFTHTNPDHSTTIVCFEARYCPFRGNEETRPSNNIQKKQKRAEADEGPLRLLFWQGRCIPLDKISWPAGFTDLTVMHRKFVTLLF